MRIIRSKIIIRTIASHKTLKKWYSQHFVWRLAKARLKGGGAIVPGPPETERLPDS